MKKTILLFSIAFLSLISCSNEEEVSTPVEIPSVGTTLQPTVGGANQPNQVYVDLSTGESKSINRTSWDFGFSSGSDYRVIINGSVKMAVKQLATSDITLVQTSDSNVAVGAGTTASSNGYVDNPTGVSVGAGAGLGSAIAAISAVDSENKVYLVNLGFAVATTTPAVGSTSVDGEARGWKKIRILRSGTGYKIQFADLASTTFTEKVIDKDTNFNFSFFSLSSASTVVVEPQKTKWDLNFTTFTNYIPSKDANGNAIEVTYGYADFIVSNSKAGTQVYSVLVADGGAYTDFTKAKIEEAKFATSSTDQRIIGASWRNGGGPSSLPSIKTDRFYVVKDVAGNYYKLKFLTMTNDAGVRGNPTFEYALLK